MFKGKSTCKILKEIRKKIAEENDIALVVEECQYQGDCAGTCPRCEAELRYLEEELRKRQQLGKAVVLAGLSAGLAISSVGCATVSQSSEPANVRGSVAFGKPTAVAPAAKSQPTTCQSEGRPITDALALMGAIDGTMTSVRGERENEKSDTVRLQQTVSGDPDYPNINDFEGMDFVADTSSSNFNNFLSEEAIIDTDSDLLMGVVGTIAEFPGGPDSLKAFIDENIQYPASVLNGSVKGVVLVEFVINKDGSVSDAKVKISLSPECDAEAVRVVSLLPKWKPEEIKGEPVRSFYQVPIPFPRVNE